MEATDHDAVVVGGAAGVSEDVESAVEDDQDFSAAMEARVTQIVLGDRRHGF